MPENGEEDSYEIEESEGIEVSTIEVVIDEAISEFQSSKTLPKKKKGTYNLRELLQTLFGGENEFVDLAVELEAVLSGYQDLILEDESN